MNLAEQLTNHHSPGNRFSYYPLSSVWTELKKDTAILPMPTQQGYGLYIHLPFCREICTYCGCNIKISRKEEEHIHYVQALLKEFELKSKNFEKDLPLLSINFGGGTPNTLMPGAQELLWSKLKELVSSKTSSGLMEADPRYFTKVDAQNALELKIDRICFGVQDFNDDILSNVNRRQSHQDLFRARENLDPTQSFGIDLLWGLPKQTKESMENWRDVLGKLSPDWISFYPLAKVPWLESIQQAYGDFTLPSRENKYLLYQWGVEIFESLGYKNLGMGHFIKSKGPLDQESPIYRKVSGLFAQKISYLMGLGVSSITEADHFMAQNDKIIDRYIHTVLTKEELPILKFHEKTELEKEMNHHIEEIFSFHQIPKELREDLQEQVPKQWIDAQTGRITPLGKHFKKNIMQISENILFKA